MMDLCMKFESGRIKIYVCIASSRKSVTESRTHSLPHVPTQTHTNSRINISLSIAFSRGKWVGVIIFYYFLFFYFHSKILQIISKLLTQGYRYHKLRKTFGKFFRSYSELLSKFGEISFLDYVSQGITHPVFYRDIVYNLWRVKTEANSSRWARK